ncbi:hypothetical protein RI367_005805 [Sorochytrium milnesiophthora]
MSHAAASPSSEHSGQKSAAMFVQSFDMDKVDSNAQLATALAERGFSVAVFVDDDKVDNTPTERHQDTRITVQPLPTYDFDLGQPAILNKSVSVYQHLRDNTYHVVYTEAGSGFAYVALLARHQSLHCRGTRFVVGVINDGDPVDIDVAYIRSQTIKLADLRIFDTPGVRSNEDAGPVIRLSLPEKPHASCPQVGQKAGAAPQGIVFAGLLSSQERDLVTFADALDRLHADATLPSRQPLNVTFIGQLADDTQRESSSLQFIQQRSARWHKFNVEVRASSFHAEPLLSFLDAHGDTADQAPPLVVVSGNAQNSQSVLSELVHCDVAVVAPRTPVVTDLLDIDACASNLYTNHDADDLFARLLSSIQGQDPRSCKISDAVTSAGSAFAATVDKVAKTAVQCHALPNAQPLVTVLLTHTRTHTLKDLQQSVASLESQRYKNFDVVLVADPGSKMMHEHIKDLSVTWWQDRGWKVVFAPSDAGYQVSHTSLQHVTGNYVLPLQSSNVVKDHALGVLVSRAEMHHADVVIGGYDVRGPPARRIVPLVLLPDHLLEDGAVACTLFNVRTLTFLVGPASWNLEQVLGENQLRIELLPEALICTATHRAIATISSSIVYSVAIPNDYSTSFAHCIASAFCMADAFAYVPDFPLSMTMTTSTSLGPTSPSTPSTTTASVPPPSATNTMTPMQVPPLPSIQVIARGPSVLSACDVSATTFNIDLSYSYGVGSLVYRYYYSGTTANVSAALQPFNGTSATLVTLPTSLVTLNASLTLQIVAQDVSNQTSSTNYTVSMVNSAPMLSIQEGPLINVGYSGGTSLTSVVAYPNCTNATQTSPNITWTVVSAQGVVGTYNTSSLYSYGSQLGYGATQVTAQLTVNGVVVTATSVVYVPFTPLVAAITSGSYMQASLQNTVNLQVAWWDNDKSNQNLYYFIWSCTTSASSGCQAQYPSTPFVTISSPSPGGGATLLPNSNYVFTVTVADPYVAGRNRSASIVVNTVSAAVPSLTITVYPAGPLSSINPIYVVGGGSFGSSYHFKREDLMLIPNAAFQWSISPLSVNTTSSPINVTGSVLYLAPNTLARGGSYTFRLTVTIGSAQGIADVQVQTTLPPSGGWLRVNNTSDKTSPPATGYAFTDRFTISTGGWSGTNTPFLYTLGCVASDGVPTYYTYQASQTSISNQRLASRCVGVFADVTDTTGNTVRVQTPVNIMTPLLTSTQTIALQNDLLGAMLVSASVSDVLSNLGTLLLVTQTCTQNATTNATVTQAALAAEVQALNIFSSVITSAPVVDQGLAVRSMSVISNFDANKMNATALSTLLTVFAIILSGSTVSGSNTVDMPMTMATSATLFIEMLLLNPAVSGGSSQFLRKRQQAGSNSAQIRSALQLVSQGMVAGDPCTVAVGPRSINSTTFALQSRRISSNGAHNTDIVRQVGNFSVLLPPLPAGCYDSHYVSWSQSDTIAAAPANGTAGVLTAQVFSNGQRSSPSTVNSMLAFNVTMNTATPPNQVLQCVYNNGTVWNSANCVTTVVSSALVSCQCPFYRDFSVAAQTSTGNAVPSATPTAGPTTSSAAAIGGAVAGVVIVGGAAGYMVKHRRTAA